MRRDEDTTCEAYFDRFTLTMTYGQASSACHPGPCDADVRDLSDVPAIRAQLDALDDDSLRATLREYGAWGNEELEDRDENEQRILWIAAGDICDAPQDEE